MFTSTNASGIAGTGKRIALVIGVNEAPNSILPPLHHAITDAEAMAEVLQQYCHFELLLSPLLGEHATSEKVKKAVLMLSRQRTDEDFLLLYFSGHGQPMTIEAGRRDVYLVTHDFDAVEVEEDENAHFSMRWLRDKLYLSTQASRVLLILDCCYAGDIGRTAPDPYLEELRERINYYFGAPGSDSGIRSGGLRLALTATGHSMKATEKDGHGLMTGLLLPALCGEVDTVLEIENQGQISLQRLHRYLELTTPSEQRPSLSGDFAGRECILASYPERAERLRRKPSRPLGSDRPRNYIPFPRNPLFQPRSGEFERLDQMLFGQGTRQQPRRIGLIGMIGMGGVGKTQLAVQLAYRYEQRFPAGIFWMPATGTNVLDWQHELAQLAGNTEYLPSDDDPSNPENEIRRAKHFCRYLANHKDVLLILDNVEDPNLVISAIPALIGREVLCDILYTSRVRLAPPGVATHFVERLPEESSLHLLLETTRPLLLSELLAGDLSVEAQAARAICQGVGNLPLALVHLRGLLARDQYLTLVRLAEMLKQHGALEIAKILPDNTVPLFRTFWLSWQKVQDERAQKLFKLASYFPEASPIPLWLLGLAVGLGEGQDIFEPLGEVCMQLRELSLIESLSQDQLRLHPLLRMFGRQLIDYDGEKGKALLEEAGERLTREFADLNKLERRAWQKGYWTCLEQVRAAREYTEPLLTGQAEQLRRVERWLDRESYLLKDERWLPEAIPDLFYQQLFNRSVEEGYPFLVKEAPARWLRQIGPVGAEDQSLLRIFSGHEFPVESVAFSPDGTKVLTGSNDRTARLWETATGKLLATLPAANWLLWALLALVTAVSGKRLAALHGHSDGVMSAAFSPDGIMILTGSFDGTTRLWETASGKTLAAWHGHSGGVTSAVFSPDGIMILTGSFDETAKLWDTASRKVLETFHDNRQRVKWLSSSRWVTGVAFSPDGTKILIGSNDGTVKLWDTASRKMLASWHCHKHGLSTVAFSPDGTKVLTGSWDGTARLWEIASRRQQEPLQGHADEVESVAFSPDGTKVLTGSIDGTARLWETATGKLLVIFEGHDNEVESVAFSPDGTRVLTGSGDGTARLWETTSGRLLAIFKGHTSKVTSVAFSPDGTKVLAGSWDRTAKLWDIASGKLLITLEGHLNWILSVTFSPDGTKMLTGSSDGTARLWETTTGKPLATFTGYSGVVTSVAFSPDGSLAITCNRSGTVLFWQTSELETAHILGAYVTIYEVGAIYWQDMNGLILADTGGPRGQPYIYRLKLEGR